MDKRLQKIETSIESLSKQITKSVANLTANMVTKDDLKGFATKDDLNKAIEDSYDDLARVVVKSFAGVDKRIGDLEQKVDRNYTGLTNQLDYVLLHYTRRVEHEKLDLRVKRLEKVC